MFLDDNTDNRTTMTTFCCNSNLVVPVVCHFVTPRVAPVLPVVPVVSVVVKIQKRLCAYLCKSVKSVGEAGGLYVIELSVRLLSYCIACRE